MERMRLSALLVLVLTASSLGWAQKKICVGAIGGGDAPMWNIQQPLLKAISAEAKSLGQTSSVELLTSSGEKQAKGEISAMKCDYTLITNVHREWPQPKSGGKEDDKNPHPSSTAWFNFSLLDKSGKRIDKFESQIEMQIRFTAKDVDPELQDIIQRVSNWVVDSSSMTK